MHYNHFLIQFAFNKKNSLVFPTNDHNFVAPVCNGLVAQLGERLNGIHEVRGSIPLESTYKHSLGIVAQLVRALPCQGRGREFEPRRSRRSPLFFQKRVFYYKNV